MATNDLAQRCNAAMNRLAKWRTHFTGWQLGTRAKGDPEADAVRDHREGSLLMRAEMTAMIGLLLEKGLITQEELQQAVMDECNFLSESLSRRWPGVTATDTGLDYDLVKIQEAGWMQGWKP